MTTLLPQKEPLRLVTPQRVLGISSVFFIVLIVSIFLSILWGPMAVDLTQAIFGSNYPNFDRILLFQERLPRALLAASVGASLSVVGVAFQALMQNPLADPFLLGTSGGAALGATILLTLGFGTVTLSGVQFPLVPIAAFAGAISSLFLIYGVSAHHGRLSTYRILLIGVVFNFFASAVIMFLKTLVQATKAQEMLFWLMGSLSLDRITPAEVAISWGITVCGSVALFFRSPELNLVSLGDEGAMHLGVDLERTRRVVFVICSVLVGAAVSITGLLGFVGLIVPHALRLVFGADHRLLIPLSAFAGAIFLVGCDLVARWMFPWLFTEAPVGIVTAFVGGPIFVWLLLHDKRLSEGNRL